MHVKIGFLLLIFSGFYHDSLAQTKITGKVTDTRGNPLNAVSITVLDSYDGATTDSAGNFSFDCAETGEQTLQATISGYTVFSQKIRLSGSPIAINPVLKELITDLNAVVLTAGAFEASDKKKGTVLSSLDVVTTAGSNGDVTGAIKTLPGTQQVGESEGLFVRGGTATESKIFIDGSLVNNFFFSSLPGIATRGRFNPFLFKGTVFSAGGYSALYGQALSSALILESVDLPDRTEASVDLSVLFAGAGIEKLAKNKKSSWGASYSYTDLSLAFKLIPQKQDFYKTPRYHTGDANFRIKTKKGILKYYGYLSQNEVGIRNPDIDTAQLKLAFFIKNVNTYHNLSYRQNLSSSWKLNTAISYSTNKDEIQNELQDSLNTKVQAQPASPYANKNFNVQNKATYMQGRLVFDKRLGGLNVLRFGADHFYSHENVTFSNYQAQQFLQSVKENLTAVFAEADIYLTKNLAAKTGLRSEHSALLNKINVAPRFSLAYKLPDASQLSFAYGIFYQNPERRYLPTPNANLDFSRATHYILQYQKIKNDRIFRSELFYKNYDRLYKTNVALSGQAAINTLGNGYAKGLELFWRDKKTINDFDYWVSYSFLDTKRNYLNFPGLIVPNFAAKHTASLVMKKFFLPIKTGFNASYTFATGRPYYNIVYDNNLQQTKFADAGKTIPYNNLSFSLNYLPALGDAKAKIFSVVVVSISNILNLKQVYGYNYGTVNTNNRTPILPTSRRFLFVGWFINFGTDRTQDAINGNL